MAAGALACLAVATRALWIGSARGRWVYPYIAPLAIQPFLVWVAATAPAMALLWARPAPPEKWPSTVLLVWVALATLVDGALRWLAPFSFEQIFLSPGANSFYTATLQHQLGTVLADFDAARAAMPLHAQSNLPGKLILVYALEQVTMRPDVLAWAMIVLSNLGAVLMYRFVRELMAERVTAFYAAILYLFVPARLFFLPLMNTITPLFLLAFGIVILRWLNTGRAAYAIAAGGILYALVLFEPLPLVTGLLFAALVMRAVWMGRLKVRTVAMHVVLMLGVFTVVAVIVQRQFGFDLMSAFASVRADAEAFNAQQRRPYDVRVKANLVEFLFGMGACQAVLVAGALWLALASSSQRWRERLGQPVVAVTVSLLAVLAVLDLLGFNRGEVIACGTSSCACCRSLPPGSARAAPRRCRWHSWSRSRCFRRRWGWP